MKPSACLLAIASCGCIAVHGDVIVSDNFSDGNRTQDPAWYISAGSFAVGSGSAFNNNSTLNQFFTTSFTATDIADGTGLRLSLAYRPDGANLNSLRVGIYSGVAPSADGWAQFSAGQPTRDWLGYYANIGLTNQSATTIVFNNNIVDDHAFFSGTILGTPGPGTNVAGVLSFRSVVFEMSRAGTDMVLDVYEGQDLDNLTLIASATHAGGSFSGFNNIALFQTTGNNLNGNIRYDDITLSTFVVPEPSTLMLLIAGATLLGLRRKIPAHP
mgnify:CR=1 FL=1